MRILHLLTTDKYSGAENVVCQIIDKFKNDSDIEMAYCSPDGDIRKTLAEKDICFFPLRSFTIKEVRRAIKQYKPDIIHAHDYKASCLAALLSKEYKVISHIHGNKKIMHSKNVKSFLFKILSKKTKKIIWVSDSCLDEFIYKDSVIKKSIILYNTVNKKDVINKSKEYLSKKYDLIFIGRLIKEKNPEYLFEIIKRLRYKIPYLNVAIIGDGPLLERLKHLTIIFDLEDAIDFYGYVNNPYPILNNSKILVITSIAEGTPMVSLEAQALNKPIVSTPIDGMTRIIKNNYNGFLCETAEDFVNKILWLLENKNYKTITKNIKDNFENINDEKGYLKCIKEIYKSL